MLSSSFGRSARDLWPLDPDVTYLNHGTVGATPRRVLEAQQAIRDEIERQPSRYLLRELSGMMGVSPPNPSKTRVAAAAVAEFVGARGVDLVFVDNATTGANAVLRSFPLAAGDEILITDNTYGAVANAARFVARERGATVRTVELPHPVTGQEGVVDSIAAALAPATRLAIVDHVTAESALVLPLGEIAVRCRQAGVAVLADGAHAPGALALDVPALGVDWYTGNLHKWAWAPRSSAFLWAAPERQATLHPPVISWGLDGGFNAEFDWVGTRDPSCFLAAVDAIAMMRDLGLEAVRAYDHELAWEGAREVSARLGTEVSAPESMIGTMATLPLPERMGASSAEAARLRDALLFEDRIEIQLHTWRGRLWIRISAQIYNDMDDIERLATSLVRRL